MLEEYIGKRIIAVGEKPDAQFPQLNVHYSGILLSAERGIVRLRDWNLRIYKYRWNQKFNFVGLDTRPFDMSEFVDIAQQVIHVFPLDETKLVKGLSGKEKYVLPLGKFEDWELKKRE